MNFEEIFEMQKSLDEKINNTHGVTFESTIDKKILALIVEVGEFANEIKPFKYWKKDKSLDMSKVLEEFVDGIHFFISIGNYFKVESEIQPLIKSKDQNQQLLEIFESISKLNSDFNKENLVISFRLYMGIAELLGITDDHIREHYISKNKVNHKRIADNY